MMALNIAVPLATVGDLMEGFGLLSPISPLSVDCRSVAAAGSHGKKQLVSPVGSESSGVSSLDSDEIKKPTSPPSTPTEEVEGPRPTSPLSLTTTIQTECVVSQDSSAKSSATSSSCSSTRSSLSSADSIIGSGTEEESSGGSAIDDTLAETASAKEIKVVLGGRDVLNLIDNLTTASHFRLQFAQLPENDNIHFFLDNRSQYHRLGANGHIQEYTMVKCNCCDFRYPVNGTSMTSSGQAEGAGRNAIISAFQQMQQHQQQQQQQQIQWNSFANNFNSIANNRDKLSLNVAPNAFNKTFGGGNSSNSNNSSNNSSGSGTQYFRGNNMVANLFGRDSNRNNFLNSTSTYNNHKSYQQNFGATNNNNSKFNAPYGGSYPVQQQQNQQPFYSKNHPMRYSNGSGNNNTNTQSNGSGTFNTTAAVAAAAALASQNLLNFNNFNSSPSSSYNNNKNNNNNMFAYYKTMM